MDDNFSGRMERRKLGRMDGAIMAKAPPCFDFYYNDWKGGTDHLTQEEKGCYLDLLIYQWQNGHIPAEPLQRMTLCRITDLGSWERIWRHISDKFECVGTHENTPLLANERMNLDREASISRWKKCVENAKNNGKRGGRPKKTQSVFLNNPVGSKKKPTSGGGRREVSPPPLHSDASLNTSSPILPLRAQSSDSSHCAQSENREDRTSAEGSGRKSAAETFAEFWSAYPVVVARDGQSVPKGNRAKAEDRWLKMSAVDRQQAAEALPALRAFLVAHSQCNQHAVTWLNQRGWLTDYAEQMQATRSIPSAKPEPPTIAEIFATIKAKNGGGM